MKKQYNSKTIQKLYKNYMFFKKHSIIIVIYRIINTNKNPLPDKFGWRIFTWQVKQ